MHVYRVLVVLLQDFWQKEEKLSEIKIVDENDVHDQPNDHCSIAWQDEALAYKKVVGVNTREDDKGVLWYQLRHSAIDKFDGITIFL